MGKQNIALFERALRMMSPYARDNKADAGPPPKSEPRSDSREQQDPHLRRLEDQIEALRQQLEALSRNRQES
jgi:polyhydroxyalkanoate synthesis regulator protein